MVYDKYTEKAIDKGVQNLRRTNSELEVRQAQPALIRITNAWVANQKRHNYNNEYERFICILSNKAITHSGNTAQLKERVKTLESLGASALTGIDQRKRQTYDEIKSMVNENKNDRVTIHTFP